MGLLIHFENLLLKKSIWPFYHQFDVIREVAGKVVLDQVASVYY